MRQKLTRRYEKANTPPEVKVRHINRPEQGVTVIEAGSLGCRSCVSPYSLLPTTTLSRRSYVQTWMSGTAEVVTSIGKLPDVIYQVLAPNDKGLEGVLRLLTHIPINHLSRRDCHLHRGHAPDAFSLASTNATVTDPLRHLKCVVRGALDKGIGVRGYVSVVILCPYSSETDCWRVWDVTRELLDMVCYEVSLGDTTGTANPTSVSGMLNVARGESGGKKLAGHVCTIPLRVWRSSVNYDTPLTWLL